MVNDMKSQQPRQCTLISPNQKDAVFYTTKEPYIFNRISVCDDASIISSNVVAPNRHMRRSGTKTHTEMHYHDYFEVVYVISGEIIQVIEDKTFRYTAGQCCILNRNIRHSEIYTCTAEILFMTLTEEFLSPLVDQSFIYSACNIYQNTFDSICHLINQNRRSRYYNVKEYINFTPIPTQNNNIYVTQNLDHVVENMVNATIEQNPGCVFIVAGLLSRFFSFLEDPSRYQKEVIRLTGSNDENLITRITKILEESRGRITRSELEEKMHYNADYLNRVVKKSTGLTLVEYGQIFSLQEAAHLLTTTNMSIIDIMTDLGFSNRNYFNKIFVAKYDMLPKEYRNEHKIKPEKT